MRSETVYRNRSYAQQHLSYSRIRYAKARAEARRKERMRMAATIAVTAIISIMVTFFCMKISARTIAAENAGLNSAKKYYKCIQVEAGDSLWTIADEEMGDEWDDKRDYVKEVIELNGLDASATIHPGNYLTLPYYK